MIVNPTNSPKDELPRQSKSDKEVISKREMFGGLKGKTKKKTTKDK